jgi:hypothetical protein
MPDADWAATQVAPDASICADVSQSKRIGAVFVAYDAAGDVVTPSGTMNIALIDVAETEAQLRRGIPAKTIVKTSPIDSNVDAGDGLAYDVAGSRLVTLRIAAKSLGVSVTHVEIYWNDLE